MKLNLHGSVLFLIRAAACAPLLVTAAECNKLINKLQSSGHYKNESNRPVASSCAGSLAGWAALHHQECGTAYQEWWRAQAWEQQKKEGDHPFHASSCYCVLPNCYIVAICQQATCLVQGCDAALLPHLQFMISSACSLYWLPASD